jgi:hypothetical protein
MADKTDVKTTDKCDEKQINEEKHRYTVVITYEGQRINRICLIVHHMMQK